jgi:hypothetical protein
MLVRAAFPWTENRPQLVAGNHARDHLSTCQGKVLPTPGRLAQRKIRDFYTVSAELYTTP